MRTPGQILFETTLNLEPFSLQWANLPSWQQLQWESGKVIDYIPPAIGSSALLLA